MTVATRAFFYIQQIEQLGRRRIDQCLQGESFTAGQYMVLNLIVHHEPVSSAELARRANMTAQSMGEFIRALEANGLIQRQGDSNNRRVILVSSTPTGRNALARAEARVDEVEREFFGCLSGEEQAHLRQLLSRVRTAELARTVDEVRPVRPGSGPPASKAA